MMPSKPPPRIAAGAGHLNSSTAANPKMPAPTRRHVIDATQDTRVNAMFTTRERDWETEGGNEGERMREGGGEERPMATAVSGKGDEERHFS